MDLEKVKAIVTYLKTASNTADLQLLRDEIFKTTEKFLETNNETLLKQHQTIAEKEAEIASLDEVLAAKKAELTDLTLKKDELISHYTQEAERNLKIDYAQTKQLLKKIQSKLVTVDASLNDLVNISEVEAMVNKDTNKVIFAIFKKKVHSFADYYIDVFTEKRINFLYCLDRYGQKNGEIRFDGFSDIYIRKDIRNYLLDIYPLALTISTIPKKVLADAWLLANKFDIKATKIGDDYYNSLLPENIEEKLNDIKLEQTPEVKYLKK